MFQNASLLAFSILILMALPGVALAQPNVTAFSFTPTVIDTSASSANVTVNFSLTGNGIFYFETAFVDPSGGIFQRASKSFTPSNSVSDSAVITFPRLSPQGTWTVAYIFALDSSGFAFLDTAGVAAHGFPTNLTVNSTSDTTPPNITVFGFTPATINTTAASASVTVNFTLTDNLAGASFFQAVFVSPSGQSSQTATKSFTPGTTVTDSTVLTFPRFSEAGAWTVSSVFIADAAGNTLVLATPDLTGRGFSTTLNVTSVRDTTPPTLTSFSFSPSSLTTFGGTVLVSPVVADDLSGVNSIQVSFVSPSGGQTVSGAVNISPPSTSPSSSATQIQLTFPNPTELGTWTQASVFISDAAGNTNVINQPISLTINPPGADTTPPLIIPTVSPMPNGAGWNNSTPVTVTWNVSDPESGISSSTNCGPTVFNAPTLGSTVTCSATNGAGLSSSASVLVKIDIAAPVTSNVLATPDPVIINTDVTITATVTDTGGSHVASAEFQVDGGPFDDLAGAFGSDTVNVSLTLPGSATPLLQTPGVHNICVRGTDIAGNIGATTCVLFAVYDPNGGFATGGGGANSPAGADLANPSGSGPVTFAFNPKYLPNNPTVPSGDLEFHYNAGNIVFKSTGWDFLVVTNGNRGQAQGTGTINGSTVCKFSLDAWNASFQPGNVDAFGLTIFNCAGGSGNRYVLPTAPITKGSIKVHQ
jgi:hypothetical protein